MQIRRHKDIIAIKEGMANPVGFHAKNMEVAELSEAIWATMAPTTFENGFVTYFEPNEVQDQEVLTALEDWNHEENPEAFTGVLGSDIRSLTINVTQICNLHCVYCAAGGDGTYGDPVAKISLEKTLPQVSYLIGRLKPGSTFSITFLGGEPLLYPEAMRSIADYAKAVAEEKNVTLKFLVITNGTLINDRAVEILKALNTDVTVSIDGPPEIQDRMRPQKNGKSSSEMAVKGIELLVKNRGSLGRILLRAVFAKNNTEVLKCYEYLSQFNPDAYEFNFDLEEADPEHNRKYVSEMAQVAKLAYERGGELELRKIDLFNNYFDSLDQQKRTENHCGSGKSLLSLDSNGKLFACPLDVGNPQEELGTVSNLDTARLSSLQEPFIAKNNCQSCWARYLCGGGCLYSHKTLTGSKHKKHTNFCERTRSLISLSLLYYEKSRH